MSVTPEPLLTVKEVARVYRVDPRTVNKWAKDGVIKSVRTPGGRLRRFRPADVEAQLAADGFAHNENGPARCSNTGQALTGPTPA